MKHVRAFFSVPPSRNDHHPAIRCAVNVGVPLLALLAMGRVDLTIYAVLGAFAGVHGRYEKHRQRFDQQWRAGVLLLLAIGAGILMSWIDPGPWIIVACTALIAGVGYLATVLWRLRPSGSMFYVFAFSAIAFTPHIVPAWQALATATASVLLSIAVGQAGRALPGHRTPWTRDPFVPLSDHERRGAYSEAWLHISAVAISGAVATWAGFGHGYWAMIACTAPLVGATAAQSAERGLHRVLGTLGGLVITGVLLSLSLSVWQLVLVVLVLQFFVELYIVRHYALAMAFITPLALIMIELARPSSPWVLLRDRGIETVLGVTVSIVLVSIVHRSSTMRAVPD